MQQHAPDRTRISLGLLAVLWISALTIVFIGLRMHTKPVLLVGLLDLALAFGATTLFVAGRRRG